MSFSLSTRTPGAKNYSTHRLDPRRRLVQRALRPRAERLLVEGAPELNAEFRKIRPYPLAPRHREIKQATPRAYRAHLARRNGAAIDHRQVVGGVGHLQHVAQDGGLAADGPLEVEEGVVRQVDRRQLVRAGRVGDAQFGADAGGGEGERRDRDE